MISSQPSGNSQSSLSGIVAALFLLSFILFASPLIERIPLAALIALMFVVSEKTFEWASLRVLRKVPKHDAFVIVAVTVVTVLTDLAIAVLVGVVISALVFAWQHAKHISVMTRIEPTGWKAYYLNGSLFFASTQNFAALFTPREDPADVVVDFAGARVMDHSAIEAIDSLAERYRAQGKRLHLRHLTPDCLELLEKARDMVEVNLLEDPHYHLADNRLG